MSFSNFYEFLFSNLTENGLLSFCFLVAIAAGVIFASGWRERIKIVFVISCTGASAFFGARIFHVLIEKPDLLKTPALIFTRYDGMTFNGSLFCGAITFALGLQLFPRERRPPLWDGLAILTAFSYGVLRVGCFVDGCCWGRPSAVSWAVTYYYSRVMPWHGIPVHPVQLYDAAMGLCISVVLIYLRCCQQKLQGLTMPLFLGLYGVGRFCTEFFRGDSFRGVNLIFGLSISQIVSLGLVSYALYRLYPLWRSARALRLSGAMASVCALFLTGCLLPEPPTVRDFKSVDRSPVDYEIYQSAHNHSGKVLIFMAADSYIQKGFEKQLEQAYNKPVRLEDLSWWEEAGNLSQIYETIYRLPYDHVGFKAVNGVLAEVEKLNRPFDVVILSHGMPNYLSTGEGYFFSFRDVDALKGELKNLDMVYLQSCFGSSLAPDFLAAGARHVIAFTGMNRNFFFYHFFFEWMRHQNVEKSYNYTVENFSWSLDNDLLFSQLALMLAPSVQEYIQSTAQPMIYGR